MTHKKLEILQDFNKRSLNNLSESKERINALEREKQSLEIENEHLEREVKSLKRELEKIKRIDTNRKQYDYQESSKVETKEIKRNRVGNRIGELFINWCKSSELSMVDRYNIFMKEIKNINTKYTVSRIFRDRNSAGITFSEDVEDAVEYWVVRFRGRSFLLPQPQRSGFKELEKCFEGNVESIRDIHDLYPAGIKQEKNMWVLKSKGIVK